MASVSTATIKKTSLLRSTGLVSLMTMVSRVMGFIRDMLIAQMFGAQAGIDAFLVAFKIPNFMRRLFAEGAFSQAFVPVLASYQEKESETELRKFIARITGNLFMVLLGVTVIAVLASPIVITIFAPGFDQGDLRFSLASDMLRITFPYLLLISLTALCGAILNTFGRFGIPAFTPVLLNICMIVAAIYFAPLFDPPVIALAWGVFIAGIIQLAFQIPFLYRAGLLIKPSFNWHDAGVKKVLKLMVPALFGVSVAQLNLLLDTVFASFLPVGSVSWLYYSDRLTFFPLGVFGVAISTVILPHLSRVHSANSPEAYSKALDWGVRMILLIAVPSTIGLCLYAKPILISLLAYGKFSQHDVLMTQKSLVTFSLGISAFMMVKLLGSAFYASQNIRTPVKIGAYAMVINSILCLLLIKPLAHAGLALASSIAGFFNAGSLMFLLIKQGKYRPHSGWGKFGTQLLVANGLLALMLYITANEIDWIKYLAWQKISLLFMMLFCAMAIYLIALYAMGMRLAHLKEQANHTQST